MKRLLLVFIAIYHSSSMAYAPSCRQILTTSSVKIAAVQFPLAERSTADQLLEKITKMVRQAKHDGASIVMFPELITTELVNWQSPVDEKIQLENIAKDFTPLFRQTMHDLSIAENIAIMSGSTPRWENGKIFNTAFLTLPNGEVLSQDKLYLTPDEKAWGWSPGDVLNIFEAPWGRTVITICFDSESPEISQLLASEKPEVILVPSWTSTKAGFNRVDWATKGLTIGHYGFVVKTGTIPDATSTQPHFGNASILFPQEGDFAGLTKEGTLNEPGTVMAELDIQLLRERRAKTGYYPAKEQEQRIKPIRIVRHRDNGGNR